jgi:hypothetical protein
VYESHRQLDHSATNFLETEDTTAAVYGTQEVVGKGIRRDTKHEREKILLKVI